MVDNNHITIEEVDSTEEKRGNNQRTSTFDQIRPYVACSLVFERLNMMEAKSESHQFAPSLKLCLAFRRLTVTSIN